MVKGFIYRKLKNPTVSSARTNLVRRAKTTWRYWKLRELDYFPLPICWIQYLRKSPQHRTCTWKIHWAKTETFLSYFRWKKWKLLSIFGFDSSLYLQHVGCGWRCHHGLQCSSYLIRMSYDRNVSLAFAKNESFFVWRRSATVRRQH